MDELILFVLFIIYLLFLNKKKFSKKKKGEKHKRGTSCPLNRILLEAKSEIVTKRRIAEEKLQFPE